MGKSRNNAILQYLFQMSQTCTSRDNGLHKTYGLIAWFVIQSMMHAMLMQLLSVGPCKGQIACSINLVF